MGLMKDLLRCLMLIENSRTMSLPLLVKKSGLNQVFNPRPQVLPSNNNSHNSSGLRRRPTSLQPVRHNPVINQLQLLNKGSNNNNNLSTNNNNKRCCTNNSNNRGRCNNSSNSKERCNNNSSNRGRCNNNSNNRELCSNNSSKERCNNSCINNNILPLAELPLHGCKHLAAMVCSKLVPTVEVVRINSSSIGSNRNSTQRQLRRQ